MKQEAPSLQTRGSSHGEAQGGLTGNANGTITPWGTIYRLRNSNEYSAFMRFGWSSANAFESYMNIQAEVPNSSLTINYYADTKTNAQYYSNVSSGSFVGSNVPTSTAAIITSPSGVSYSISNTGKISGLEQKYTSVHQFQSISKNTMTRVMREPGFPAYKIAGVIRIGEDELEDNRKIRLEDLGS